MNQRTQWEQAGVKTKANVKVRKNAVDLTGDMVLVNVMIVKLMRKRTKWEHTGVKNHLNVKVRDNAVD